MIGARYATALRDVITRSPRYQLTDSQSEGVGKEKVPNWALQIVSIDDEPSSRGHSTAISVVLEIEGFVITQPIQICGEEKIDGCAATTLASFDADINTPIGSDGK